MKGCIIWKNLIVGLVLLLFQLGNTTAEPSPDDIDYVGGEIYLFQIPIGFELYSNAPKQKYLFTIDFDEKGNVSRVFLRKGHGSGVLRNTELLQKVIKKWKATPLKGNGKLIDKWGGHYTFLIGGNDKEASRRIQVFSGIKKVFEANLPMAKVKSLNKKELQAFHEAARNSKKK